MARITHRVYNDIEANGQMIRRYPVQGKDGTYSLANSVGNKSNLGKNSVRVTGLDKAIELMATNRFKIRVSGERGAKPALLVFDSISIPEISHFQEEVI